MTPTCSCGRPVKDNARICAACTTRLERDLGDLGALDAELTTTRLRQSRMGGAATGVLSRSYERPLNWNERAAEGQEILRSTVWAWVKVVLDERGGRLPTEQVSSQATFLLSQLEWLRHHDGADGIADEMHHVAQQARICIDTPAARLYAGPCDPEAKYSEQPCPTDLYAREGASRVLCPTCGLDWDVDSRRRDLLEAAGDRLATAADLSRFLTAYGEPLTAERIRKWAERDQLVPHGHDAARRPLYRVSEVVALLASIDRKRAS